MSYCVQHGDADHRFAERAPRRLSHFDGQWEDSRILLARGLLDDLTTWLCLVPSNSAASFRTLVQDGGVTVGPAKKFDALRVAKGIPEFGQDVSSDNLPQEVNRDGQAISFRKGCYLGQETVARIDALGHVNRLLLRLQFPAGHLPEPGAAMTANDSERTVGQITSVARLDEHAVGLGYVRREYAVDGAILNCPAGTVRVLATLGD